MTLVDEVLKKFQEHNGLFVLLSPTSIRTRMTNRTDRMYLNQQSILVAILFHGNHVQEIAALLAFSDLMALLPKGGRFYMSGRSLLLNFSQVISVEEDGSVRLKNGSCLFCSRLKKKETKEDFKERFRPVAEEFDMDWHIYDADRPANNAGSSSRESV